MPTTYEHWIEYTKTLPCPQSYIDFGFYYLIGAALQRRVWFSREPHQVFPNFYIFLVGPPAVGKGVVCSVMNMFLKFHKDTKKPMIKTNIGEEAQLLFPNGPDSVTFEQLLVKFSSGGKRMVTPDNKPYYYTGMWFILDELSSLFKQKTEDVGKLLIAAYDGKDYNYEIKHQEKKDRIRNICLSFCGCTQFDYMQEMTKQGFFGQGLASRVICLFETRPRFESWHIAEDDLTPEQLEAEVAIKKRLLQLSTIYGRLTYSKETYDFLEDYQNTVLSRRKLNASLNMQEYLGRKKVHTYKVAAAMHFADSDSLEIPLSTFQAALKVLDAIEANISAGFAMTGKNPLHVFTKKLYAYIKDNKEVEERTLILEFGSDLTMEQLQTCLKELELGHGVKSKIKSSGRSVYYL